MAEGSRIEQTMPEGLYVFTCNPGKSPTRISAELLSELGVSTDIILAATTGGEPTTVYSVRKVKVKE